MSAAAAPGDGKAKAAKPAAASAAAAAAAAGPAAMTDDADDDDDERDALERLMAEEVLALPEVPQKKKQQQHTAGSSDDAAPASAAASAAAGAGGHEPEEPKTPALVHAGPDAAAHARPAMVRVPRALSMAQASDEIKYVACMVLSGVGDAIGYANARWEFNRSGPDIHAQMMKLTKNQGVMALQPAHPHWVLSDDTIMHIATAAGLIAEPDTDADAQAERRAKGEFWYRCKLIAAAYSDCMDDMGGRAPGGQTMSSMYHIDRKGNGWDQIAYGNTAGGCGAAMRSMCLGLAWPREEDVYTLVAFGIETGRTTHHNPSGYLGAVAGGLFTSYALQGVPPVQWGTKLLSALELAERYIKASGRDVNRNLANTFFRDKWVAYLQQRGLLENDGKTPTRAKEATFPLAYGVAERDVAYNSWSYDGWGGSSGHDAPMIAYDALLSALRWLNTPAAGESGAAAAAAAGAASSSKDAKQPDGKAAGAAAPQQKPNYAAAYEQLILHGVLNGGDSDSTGCMCMAWWGALHGFQGVPKGHYEGLEYFQRLVGLGQQLYQVVVQHKLHDCVLTDPAAAAAAAAAGAKNPATGGAAAVPAGAAAAAAAAAAAPAAGKP